MGGQSGRGTATDETRLLAAVQGYGTPQEVAAAYVGAPVSTAPGAGGPGRGAGCDSRRALVRDGPGDDRGGSGDE